MQDIGIDEYIQCIINIRNCISKEVLDYVIADLERKDLDKDSYADLLALKAFIVSDNNCSEKYEEDSEEDDYDLEDDEDVEANEDEIDEENNNENETEEDEYEECEYESEYGCMHDCANCAFEGNDTKNVTECQEKPACNCQEKTECNCQEKHEEENDDENEEDFDIEELFDYSVDEENNKLNVSVKLDAMDKLVEGLVDEMRELLGINDEDDANFEDEDEKEDENKEESENVVKEECTCDHKEASQECKCQKESEKKNEKKEQIKAELKEETEKVVESFKPLMKMFNLAGSYSAESFKEMKDMIASKIDENVKKRELIEQYKELANDDKFMESLRNFLNKKSK